MSKKSYFVLAKRGTKESNTIKAFSSRSRGHQPFAKKLKEDVHKILNITGDVSKLKDIKREDGSTLRDHYIKHGKDMREINVDHWVNETYKVMVNSKEEYVDITDYRFPNEGLYIKEKYPNAITCRVYRSNVPIPNYDISTEHSLDETSTDYFLVDGIFSLLYSIYYFPQYFGKYHITGCLIP